MKYEAPKMEIVMFETEEVIVASTGVPTTTVDDGPADEGDI